MLFSRRLTPMFRLKLQSQRSHLRQKVGLLPVSMVTRSTQVVWLSIGPSMATTHQMSVLVCPCYQIKPLLWRQNEVCGILFLSLGSNIAKSDCNWYTSCRVGPSTRGESSDNTILSWSLVRWDSWKLLFSSRTCKRRDDSMWVSTIDKWCTRLNTVTQLPGFHLITSEYLCDIELPCIPLYTYLHS